MRETRWVAAAALAVACGAALAGGTVERKLLQNGDFEEGVAGWSVLDRSGQSSFEPDTGVKQSGKQSLRIARAGPGDTDWLKQFVEAPAGVKELRAVCWFKVDKGARADVKVRFSDAADNTVGKGEVAIVNSGPNKKWEKADLKIEVPKGTKSIGINVEIAAKGTFWLDGLELSYTAPAAAQPAVANGDFEKDLASWRPLALGTDAVEVKADAAVRAEGKASARIVRTTPRLLPEAGLETEVLCEGDPGRQRLRFQARADDGAGAAVVLQAFDAKGRCLATERAAVQAVPGKFVPGSLLLAPPAETRKLVVSLVVSGAGKAWFDDVTLAPEK